MHTVIKVLLAVALAACAMVALAASTSATQKRSVESAHSQKQGYWWKKEPPAAPPESEYKDLPPPPPEEELLQLHPKQIEKLIEDYRQYALWKMEPKHVVWYFQLQDFARRRSRAFMNVTELVMLQNPDLNLQTVYPTNPPGQAARVAQREDSLQHRLALERDQAALVFLTRKGCEYCDAMRGILKYFQERHGWTVKEIDVEEFPAEASRFAVEYTPTTVVIFRGSSEWMPVAVGVETLEKVEEGAYRAVRFLRGETSPLQYTLQEFNEGGPFDPQRMTK